MYAVLALHEVSGVRWGRRFRLPNARTCSNIFPVSHPVTWGCQITPSVSEGTVSPAPLPRADAWGYLDRQWIGFHHTFVGRRPIATGWKPAADCSIGLACADA